MYSPPLRGAPLAEGWGEGVREVEAPAESMLTRKTRLGRSLALPDSLTRAERGKEGASRRDNVESARPRRPPAVPPLGRCDLGRGVIPPQSQRMPAVHDRAHRPHPRRLTRPERHMEPQS